MRSDESTCDSSEEEVTTKRRRREEDNENRKTKELRQLMLLWVSCECECELFFVFGRSKKQISFFLWPFCFSIYICVLHSHVILYYMYTFYFCYVLMGVIHFFFQWTRSCHVFFSQSFC